MCGRAVRALGRVGGGGRCHVHLVAHRNSGGEPGGTGAGSAGALRAGGAGFDGPGAGGGATSLRPCAGGTTAGGAEGAEGAEGAAAARALEPSSR